MVIILYSLIDMASYYTAVEMVKSLRSQDQTVSVYLIGNKMDEVTEYGRAVAPEEVKEMSQ